MDLSFNNIKNYEFKLSLIKFHKNHSFNLLQTTHNHYYLSISHFLRTLTLRW